MQRLNRARSPSREWRVAAFTPRSSLLDRENKQGKELVSVHGFVNLFWLAVVIYASLSLFQQARQRNDFVFSTAWHRYYRDWLSFAVYDIALVLYAFVGLLLQKLRGSFRLGRRGLCALLIRFVVPGIGIAWSICVAQSRQWPPIQTGTFVAHAVVLAMKMHSYLVTCEQLGSERAQKPVDSASVSLRNFADYLLVPTLVYEPSYPRLLKVRWEYLLDRTVGIGAIVCLLYVIVEHYIYPVLAQLPTISKGDALVSLLLPFTISYILVFFLVFEYILNWFAEITCFADRHFYADWWNSLTFAEFSRKWNIPVHRFLHRHVYQTSMQEYKLGRFNAVMLTFVFSAMVHELIMSAIAGRFNGLFFLLQLSQIPLILLSTKVPLQKWPLLSNMFFWCCMIVGLPLVAVLYCRDCLRS